MYRNIAFRLTLGSAAKVEKLTLAVRTYECAACGHAEDRGVNAAKNIIAVGLVLDRPGGVSPARR